MQQLQTGAEHVSQSEKLVVVVGRRCQCDDRDALGEGEHGGMVCAGDHYPASADLLRDVLWAGEATQRSSPFRKTLEEREGRPPVLRTELGDDDGNETGAELPRDGLH